MSEFIQSGQVYELIIGLILLEFFALHFARRFGGAELSLVQLSATLLAGGLLVLSFLLASGGADPRWVLACLLACGVAHAIDLALRVRMR